MADSTNEEENEMELSLQSHEQLSASVALYKQQLIQIEDYLKTDPLHDESLQMKEALIEIIQLSSDIMDNKIEGMEKSDNEEPLDQVKSKSSAEGQAAPKRRKIISESEPNPAQSRKNASRGMNPKNKYAENVPDFLKLADAYPSLRPYVTPQKGHGGRGRIDWTSFEATRELTRALLHHDFGIKWWIPDGHLCPPVPNRSNYIHWIHDLLAVSSPRWQQKEDETVRGVDIGTGASCIYPLLGASIYGWHFLATDVTEEAMAGASQNVNRNPQLAEAIEVRRSGDSSTLPGDCPLLLGVIREDERFHFCMCNPPFFESAEEAGANPRTACGGSMAEMVYPGGELAFINRIVQDSLVIKERIHWYSSMVGKKQHIKALTAVLRKEKATVVRCTEFVQGRTSRWGIAWSFSAQLLQSASSLLVAPSLSFQLQGIGRSTSAWDILQLLAAELDLHCPSVTVDQSDFSIVAAMGSINASSTAETCPKFKVQVYQQSPGSVSIRSNLLHPHSVDVPVVEMFSSLLHTVESELKRALKLKDPKFASI